MAATETPANDRQPLPLANRCRIRPNRYRDCRNRVGMSQHALGENVHDSAGDDAQYRQTSQGYSGPVAAFRVSEKQTFAQFV